MDGTRHLGWHGYGLCCSPDSAPAVCEGLCRRPFDLAQYTVRCGLYRHRTATGVSMLVYIQTWVRVFTLAS
jgi:hypothetical protein